MRWTSPRFLITVEWLEAHNACRSQVEVFKRVFPKDSKLTLADCRKARKAGLDRMWTLCQLLEEHGLLPEFTLFILGRCQPDWVRWLDEFGCSEQARAVEALDWQDWTKAEVVLRDALDHALDHAFALDRALALTHALDHALSWDMQVRWILGALRQKGVR